MKSSIILALLAFPLASFAQGGPPLLTDDPSTPGEGHYEINTAITANYRENRQSFDAPLIDMNFGVGPRGQLKLEVPLTTETENGNNATTGLGSVLLGWKWRFYDQYQTMPVDISVYPQLASSPLTLSKSWGVSERNTEYLLPVEIAHSFENFSLNTELGYVLRTQNQQDTFYGIALGWKAGEQTEWLAEYHRILSDDVMQSECIINLGLRHELIPHMTLLVAAGVTPYSTGADYNHQDIYLGLQFTN